MYAMNSILDLTSADKKKVTSSDYIDEARHIANNTFVMAKKLKELPKDKWRNDPAVN